MLFKLFFLLDMTVVVVVDSLIRVRLNAVAIAANNAMAATAVTRKQIHGLQYLYLKI